MEKLVENAENNLYEFKPDYAVPPGQTLLEVIDSLSIKQTELAERAARPTKTINEIIKGKVAITPETALQFERVLNIPARFWNNLELNYQEALARIQEGQRLEADLDFLKQLPINGMIKNGWIKKEHNKISKLKEALNFFGVASVTALKKLWLNSEVDFRKSYAFQSNPWIEAAWLRKGELEGQKIFCKSFTKDGFELALNRSSTLTSQESPHCAILRKSSRLRGAL